MSQSVRAGHPSTTGGGDVQVTPGPLCCHYRGKPVHFAERPNVNVQKLFLTAALAVAALTAMAAPAGAATPFTVGQGNGARMVADSDGIGHVVWSIPSRGGAPAGVGYCRIPVGGSACDVTKVFEYPSAPGQVAQADPLDISIHAPRPMEILIAGSCTSCGDGSPADQVYMWQSTTSGVSWNPPPFTVAAPTGGGGFLGSTPTTAGLSPGALWVCGQCNLLVSPGEGNKALVFAQQGAAATAIDTVGSGHVHTPSIVSVPVAGGAVPQLVYAASDLGSIQYSVYEGAYDGLSVADSSKWSFAPKNLTVPAPDSAEPQLSSGPTSTYLTYRRSVPGDNQILIRRFNSDTTAKSFGLATQIQGGDPIDNSADAPDSAQDQSGRVHVIWTSGHDAGRLRYVQSDVSGTTFSNPVSIARGETFGDPDIGAAPSGAGWATWSTGGDSPIRVVKLEAISDAPIVTPPPATCTPPATGTPPNCKAPTTTSTKPVTRTVSVSGASITFGVQRACVKPGAKFKVTLTWKKRKKKGNRFVKVAKADFYIGSKIVKTDRVAPFTQTLTVTASAKAGSKLTVKARAHIKVKRGKSPKKSISSSVKVCA
jgi:hypothetical protein